MYSRLAVTFRYPLGILLPALASALLIVAAGAHRLQVVMVIPTAS
jgi:hypothetical protein